ELRLSEFAGMASYAQGPPTNITFSENIGFLTKSEPKANAAFWATAHEAAHQWWPCMAMPGDGPGGEVLSEGMAHFSPILLTEQVRGLQQRIAFCKWIEDQYDNTRQRDSERPLVEIDGALPGDRRLIYDRGGDAVLMLHRLMGREANLAAHREYLATWRDTQDHPLIQDYLAVMRRHAPDTAAFDAFVKQWFYTIDVPQYLITDARLVRAGAGWEVRARVKNGGTGPVPVEIAATRGARSQEAHRGDRRPRPARHPGARDRRGEAADDRLRLRTADADGGPRRHRAHARAPESRDEAQGRPRPGDARVGRTLTESSRSSSHDGSREGRLPFVRSGQGFGRASKELW